MWQRTFFLFGSFLVLCAIPSKSDVTLDTLRQYVEFLDEQEFKKIVNTKNSGNDQAIREIDGSRDEKDSYDFGCWRYCAKKRASEDDLKNGEPVKRVNIIWNIDDEAEVTLAEKRSSNWGIFADLKNNPRWESSPISSEKLNIFSNNDTNCDFFLEIGCKSLDEIDSSLSTINNEFTNVKQKELISKNDAIGSTSTSITVSEDIEDLRILAFGKLLQIVIEIPIENNSTTTRRRRLRPMFSLSRTSDAEGLFVDARNPPSGQWRLNLLGMENLNYNFTVISTASKKSGKYSNENNSTSSIAMLINKISARRNESGQSDMELSENLLRPQRMAYPEVIEDSAETIELDEQREIQYQLSSGVKLRNLSRTSDSSMTAVFSPKQLARAGILGASELSDFSRSVDDVRLEKRTAVDIHPDTELIVRPGVLHDVVFTVTNNQPLEIRHTFRGTSSLFPFVTVIPNEFWIRAGETINVAVRIKVPNLEQTEPSTVTLYVHGNDEVGEKSTYVYVENFDVRTPTDSEKPKIDWSFNDNCSGKLHRDRCARSRWSVEITVSDTGSGLKRVTSVPSGVEPLTEFIGGTKQQTIFYYSSTCCQTTVDIKAIDLRGNSYTQRIDVTAWDNLSPGEIAAIVLGSLLILLLLICIIILIICCIRRRKSHDLSYSQRYGSRSPANAERTNF